MKVEHVRTCVCSRNFANHSKRCSMYGLVHSVIRDLIKTKFGDEVWAKVLAEAGVYSVCFTITFRCRRGLGWLDSLWWRHSLRVCWCCGEGMHVKFLLIRCPFVEIPCLLTLQLLGVDLKTVLNLVGAHFVQTVKATDYKKILSVGGPSFSSLLNNLNILHGTKWSSKD